MRRTGEVWLVANSDVRSAKSGYAKVTLGEKRGAGDWIRTRNRLFTKQVLYR